MVVVVASLAAWSLARQQNSLATTLVRALADGSAVVTLGLAAVPMLDIERYRGELIRRATAPLTIAAAAWLLAELLRLGVAAAQAAAIPVSRLGLHTAVDFALHTAAGRSGLFSAIAAALVGLAVAAAPRSVPMNVAVAGFAAAGMAARPLTGHFSESTVGGVAVAVHTLAAATWCGVLAALLLTVEHRGQWARVLPRFSQLSLLCVAALLLGGVLAAAVTIASPSQLYSTGYGRLLAAKVVVTVVLVVLAYRNRTMWLPAARSHRATAVVSRSRSLFELAIMAVALTLAAALAVTG
ncbi:putative copper resistance protein D [Mycolicibacterium moriokaense]|uniref:Putative copper resistance protein D n=1 Tax=Mycolicibacterium moriokaense TaxID=39691 RepID=A0A318HMY0_9MYCO|nr:putative copper resistance protein D [Mycolicibacterium moriokaense]